MEVQSGFADINGTRLYYETTGAGRPLVLIHGFSLDSRMWADQFLLLAAHFQVLRYDLRGFGQSPPPDDDPYSHAADLKELLAFFHFEQAHLVGFSFGGQVAVDFALTYQGAVDHLILVSSVLGGYQWSEAWDATVVPIWRQGRAGEVDKAREMWLRHSLFETALANARSRDRCQQLIDDYSGWHWTDRDPGLGLEPPAVGRLAEIHVPTLVINGQLDLPDFHSVGALLAENIPTAQRVVVPGAGHMLTMEVPERFNELTLTFLGVI